MDERLSKWLAQALRHSGMKQAQLAEALGRRLHMSMDRSKVNKMVAGTRAISASELIAISEITGHPMPTQKAAGLSESDEAYVTSPDIQRNAKDPRGVFSHLKHNDVAVTIRGKTLIVNAAVDKKNIPRLRRMIDAMEKLMDDD